MFTTRFGPAIVRVMNHYAMNPSAMAIAMEVLIKTAMDSVPQLRIDELAQQYCEEKHDGMAAGLVCRKCYDAMQSGRLAPEDSDQIAGIASGSGGATASVDQKLRTEVEEMTMRLLNMKDEQT